MTYMRWFVLILTHEVRLERGRRGMVGAVGSSAPQWAGAILPRIRDCLPVGTILEIVPGFGRWTHYLKDYCDKRWILDRSTKCIQAGRHRFESHLHRVTWNCDVFAAKILQTVESDGE